jgi:hypothetical protein
MNQSIADKIVNHFVANYFLIPYLEYSLIDGNVATRKNRGSSYGINLLKKYFNKLLLQKKEIYCLKIDISKYFYNIDHDILINMLEKRIKDKDAINLIKLIINQTNRDYINNYIERCNYKYNIDIPLYNMSKGLSIGAMTSQFMAIYFLNDVDHYIKEELKCKYYIRYMDDFIILDTDKEKLLTIYSKITQKLKTKNLNINRKSNIYKCSNSFKFLGYKFQVINNKLVMSSNNKTFYRIKRRIKKLHSTDYIKYMRSKGSYCGYFKVLDNRVGGDFRLKIQELYRAYKDKYIDSIIIIKEGIFYKTFSNDAKIIWFLFGYKYISDITSFGSSPYNKVILKLKELDINFIVIDKSQELIISLRNNNNYSIYESLANKSFEKNQKIEEIHHLVDKLLNDNDDNYDKINTFLLSMSK